MFVSTPFGLGGLKDGLGKRNEKRPGELCVLLRGDVTISRGTGKGEELVECAGLQLFPFTKAELPN